MDGVRASYAAGHHSPLLVAPCGFGKTICFVYMASRLVANGKRVAILAHRDELIDQCSEALVNFDVRHGCITAGSVYDRRLMCHVASVFTLARRLDRVAVPDYAIVDEAHHAVGESTWGKVLNYWRAKNPSLRVLGCSATPTRLSGEGLGETFDDMILGPSTADLIAAGRLSPYRLFAPSAPDLSGVHTRAGEYSRGELGAVMDKPAIVGNAVHHYRKLCDGMPAVAFCVSVEHAHHTAEQFRAAGYRAVGVDGKMDKQMRRALVQDFSRGAINVLTSCSLIDEGFNCPGIVAAIDLAPTQSLSRYIQRGGRALRAAPGKDVAFLLDHAGNAAKHGLPDDPREWSLMGAGDRGKKNSDGGPAARQCERCFACSPAAASKCRECGAAFPIKARVVEEVAGTLSEVEIARMRTAAVREQAAARTLEDLIAVGMSRGMKNPAGWARHIAAAREAKQQRAGR